MRFISVGILLIAGILFWWGCNPQRISLDSISATDLDGNIVDWNIYKGKPLFINFWATWCGPCLYEKPRIEALRKKLEPKGWVFIMLSDESTDKIRRYQAAKKYPFIFLHLSRSRKWKGVVEIPHTYIFNRDGKTVMDKMGAQDWDTPAMLTELEKAVE